VPAPYVVHKIARSITRFPEPMSYDLAVNAEEIKRAVGDYDDGLG